MNKAFNVFGLLILSTVALAQNDQVKSDSENPKPKPPAICENHENAVVKTFKPSEAPNYFFRTFKKDGKDYISYAGKKGNIILDLETEEEHAFKGKHNIDPVPVGTDLITVPWPIHFHKISEILKGDETPDTMPVKDDYQFMGVYQSVGKLGSQDGKTKYRILTDEVGATISDYDISGEDITMVGTPRGICRDKNFKLPMLSKDGKMISGFDLKTSTTKIWKINGNGTCDEIADLGIGTGKADFNYDGTKITFHTSNQDDATDYFRTADSVPAGMNVFVYDLKNKNLKQITHNGDSANSYYPVFKEDDTILYGEINSDGVHFVHSDPAKIKGQPFDSANITNTAGFQLGTMGLVWSKMCGGTYGSIKSGAALMLSMPPEKCHEFIKNYWKDNSEDLRQGYAKEGYDLSPVWDEKRLYAACSRDWSKLPESKDLYLDLLPKGAKIAAAKCGICHDAFSAERIPYFKFNDQLIKYITQRLNSTGPDKMPQSGTLTDEEKTEIIKFMNLRREPQTHSTK